MIDWMLYELGQRIMSMGFIASKVFGNSSNGWHEREFLGHALCSTIHGRSLDTIIESYCTCQEAFTTNFLNSLFCLREHRTYIVRTTLSYLLCSN